MAPYVRPCAVRDCINPPDSKRFTFPRTVIWAEKWRTACANPKIKHVPAERLHTRYVVCRKHFSREHFANDLMERLLHGIVPKHFLPTEESLYASSCIPESVSENVSEPFDPTPEVQVILPAVDIGNTQDTPVANDTDTCTNESQKENNDFNKEAPPMSFEVPPTTRVLLVSNGSEVSVLEPAATETPVAPINDYYRYTLCRLCFCGSDSLTDIFEEYECGFVISDAIEDLLRFKVSKTDDYPQFICPNCLFKLNGFKKFKDILCKQKETFDKELQKLRKGNSEDEDDSVMVSGNQDGVIEENLENSKDAYSIKNLSELEEIAEENFRAEPSEGASESLEDLTDFEDPVMEEWIEPETVQQSSSEMKDIVLQGEYKCHECGEIFQFVNLLASHVKEHRKAWPYPCQYCEKRFKTLMDLNGHVIMHSDYKPFECEHCGLRCRTKTTLIRHKMTHSAYKPFLCSTCGISFRDRVHLRNHLRMHSNINCYKCEECGMEFRTGSKLANHCVVHMKESPYTCGECGKSFKKLRSLSWHITCIHSGEKQFQCELCNKSFSIRKYLCSHMKIHRRNALS